MNEFDSKYNIIDEPTPELSLLCGHYKKSFAYYTLRDRLPIILTQIIDNLAKAKDALVKNYGEESREEIKTILGNLSKLKYELQTDKPLSSFNGDDEDLKFWDNFLDNLEIGKNSYYSTCWLYAETYMYRRIHYIFSSTRTLGNYDYFGKQKRNALTCCTSAIENILKTMKKLGVSENNLHDHIKRLLKVNLWGNRCDLSISEGKEIKQTGDPLSGVNSLDQYVLIDDSGSVCECLSAKEDANSIVDFVLDNSGYEFFTDLLIANFFIERKIATKIRFHVKSIPWYISDVTPQDFDWTINYLRTSESKSLAEFGEKLYQNLRENKFELCETESFWTGPYEYYRMIDVKPKLYENLSQAHLLIFKGDLNYRKLIGDFSWKFTEKFEVCLRGFFPTNICSLRTVKADIICGLQEGVADQLNDSEPDWMVTGKYGTIQFARRANL